MLTVRRLQYALLGTSLAYLLSSFVYLGLRLEQQSKDLPSLPNESLSALSSLSVLASNVQLQAIPSLSPPCGSCFADEAPKKNEQRGSSTTTLHHQTWVMPASVEDNPTLPPFSSLFDSYGNVTGDVQFLLDFAIIGFGKCGACAGGGFD